ncbi:RuvX/YqgF family protein [Candidatus Mycoplasma haematohominis]|uniref:Holliday junction resolvase-like protein n=1 Tax=Candidatus Mycoplasma haematohominis TaxID=1494318 RepID=A0A478FTC0_9MOLU|nr:RuvX/YqgF family protein [Candidatus Mycoplasma haemohominis]GCE63335.1 Holliday junction resolvase-like protein [Candidatus Mycoplasma haemohominis]
MRVLGIDVGRNKTGLAISSEELELITPLRKIEVKLEHCPDKWFDELIYILKKRSYEVHEIDKVVIGSWEDNDYRNVEMKRLVKLAIKMIEAKTDWKVILVRETNTTVESRRILKELGISKNSSLHSIDSYAAFLLLIDYFELVKPRQEDKK